MGCTEDVFAALDVQDKLQTLYTSGTVFHTFLGEKLPDWQAAAALVRKIAENYELPYYTLSPTYSVCADHGYLAGEQFTCPICGRKTEVYSRITGYYRPVQNWNDGKSPGVSGQKNLSGERCSAAPCSRSGRKKRKRPRPFRGRADRYTPVCYSHLPQLPGGEAAAAKGGRSL